MNKGFFISATDTDVGKTTVGAGLCAALALRFKTDVQLWKPVQTGVEVGSPQADSYRLLQGSGVAQQERDLVSYTFPDPLAPWMAAQRSGKQIDYIALIEEGLQRKKKSEFFLVEGAGGLAVPLTSEYLMVDMARDLQLPLLLVARPGLGTVNHTLLTIAYARSRKVAIAGIVINGVKETEDHQRLQENIHMIEHFGEVPVVGQLPWLPEPEADAAMDAWLAWRNNWTHTIIESLKWDVFLQ